MPSLCSIPREVRDKILEYVIFSHRAPPGDPNDLPQDRIEFHDKDRPWRDSCIKYERQSVVPSSLSLLLVNRQLSAETRSALDRVPTSYHLDVILFNGKELWSTWLSVPELSSKVDNVVASFRVFGACPKSMFEFGCGSPPHQS